jgi:hypothetical protein
MLTLSESTGKYRGQYPTAEQTKEFNRKVAAFCRLFYGKYRGRWNGDRSRVVENRRRYQGAGTFAVNEFGDNNNNLHCHILLYGPWIPYKELLAAWVEISGGDTGVYIEPIRGSSKAARYVSKYIMKPPRFGNLCRAINYLVATKGLRRIRTGGGFYNALKKKKTVRNEEICPICDSVLVYDGVVSLDDTRYYYNWYDVRRDPERFGFDLLRGYRPPPQELPEGVMPI